MSGICGVLALDGSQPAQADLDAMIARLERRGPDGSHRWRQGPVALGHTLLATTPESLAETLPITDPHSGCTITADARLDNRDELLAALDLAKSGRIVGDGELILRAYQRWGEDCPARLLGDFAFAIWDPRSQSLFCARDHMGMRQLLYHHTAGARFVFATEAQSVLAHSDVPRRINEARIADFLDDLEGIDLTSTFFMDVARLPPAHCLTVSRNGVRVRRYWRLEPVAELKLDSDEDYAQAFLDVFTEAVRCRLRSSGPVGSMLSGGMDSGSVTAVAAALLATGARQPLQTFSAIGPDAESCVETRTILSAAAIPGITPHFINHADMAALQSDLMELPDNGEPFDFDMTLIRAVYLAAHRQGIRIMLDGVAGDVALTCGNRVARLARDGRILRAVEEARAEGRFWGPTWPPWKALAQAFWAAWVPYSMRKWRRRMLDRLVALRTDRSQLMSAELAKNIDLAGRRHLYSSHSDTERAWGTAKRIQAIAHPHLAAARERYDRVASAMAIEPRDPFMDIRLVQFCLSLPDEQLQSDGWPKLVLRRAMGNILPESVLWRRGKEHLGWTFTRSLFEGWDGWSEDLRDGEVLLERFVRPSLAGGSNQPGGKALDIAESFKLFFLLSWLRRSGSDPADATPRLGKEHAEESV